MGHLSLGQRYQIEAYTAAGFKDNKIAEHLDVSKSVISREKKRNSDQRNGAYRAGLAQRKADARKASKNKHKRFDEEMRQRIEQLVKQDFSLKAIATKKAWPACLMNASTSTYGQTKRLVATCTGTCGEKGANTVKGVMLETPGA